MVSPELLRRYPFFARLSLEHLTALANLSEERTFAQGERFFREGQILTHLYLVLQGQIALTLKLPVQGNRAVGPELSAQQREVVLATISAGELCAWSAVVPPYEATSNGQAVTDGRLVEIDCVTLRTLFDRDPVFGFAFTLQIAQVMRDRIRDLHNESLADLLERA
ncbi:Crp/Fnr family transcriptional regulator [Candidatus Chloroploca sp. Khr17]|uniref:Crp/Fnr family transcriptional regulator n=1 Tax=Candidatus Chloroploca sp. Khr17 TaxID=2496869 RepID=UPI00101D00E4|nr:Crp/Fnr family transcriptional regulator [Candidatus Chloroploca sp. Khr17]